MNYIDKVDEMQRAADFASTLAVLKAAYKFVIWSPGYRHSEDAQMLATRIQIVMARHEGTLS